MTKLGGPLRVELSRKGEYRSARLLEEYVAEVTVNGKTLTITVPAGFETDFASVPRAFWRIVPPWGEYSPAAVVHDYLYATALLPRAGADWVFLELMTELGVPWWKRQAMYRAVRLGGGFAWDERGRTGGGRNPKGYRRWRC